MTTGTRDPDTTTEGSADLSSDTRSGHSQAVSVPVEPPPTPSPTPIISDEALAKLRERGAIAQQAYYLMSMPVLTQERVQELETSLPAILETIKSIRYKPSVRNEILPMIEAMKQQGLAAILTPEDEARVQALAELILNDVRGEEGGERFAQVAAPAVGLTVGAAVLAGISGVGLGVACFTTGYIVAHNWGR